MEAPTAGLDHYAAETGSLGLAMTVPAKAGICSRFPKRSCPFCAKASSADGGADWFIWPGKAVAAPTEAACAIEETASRILVDANSRLKRAPCLQAWRLLPNV